MYAQEVDTGQATVRSAAEMDDAERVFQARLDADIKIEPRDYMPDAYRRTLIRQIQQSAAVRASKLPPSTMSAISGLSASTAATPSALVATVSARPGGIALAMAMLVEPASI